MGVADSKCPEDLENEVNNVCQDNIVKNVENLKNVEKLYANMINIVGDMPVPSSGNSILNPGGNVSNEHRIDARKKRNGNGEMGGMVWPSLNEVARKDKGINGEGSNDIDILSKIHVRVNKEGNNVVDMDPLLEQGSKKCDLTLVGYFVGLKMGYAKISGHLRRMWRTRDLARIITNECGLYFLKFRSIKGMCYVLENRPWLVEGKPLFVRKLEAGLCMEKLEPTRVPLWVKNMNVPLEAWNTHGLWESQFCKGLIEIDATKELADSIEVCYSSMGKSIKLRVRYAWKPPLYTHCKVFGHDFKNYSVRQRTEEEKNERVNDKKHDLSYGVEDSLKANGGTDGGYIGGYIGRCRGGMYGRGNMNGRGGLSGGRGMYGRGNMNGRGGLSEGRGDNVGGSNVDKGKKTDNAKSGNVKKVVERDKIHVKNSFSVLNDEMFESGGEEWVLAKGKIDLVVELGLRWRIAKLQKDIAHGNTYVSKVANEEAEKQYVAYEGLMGEKVSKIMNESLQGSQMECMDDEVAEDISRTTKFIARNEVSNVDDGNDSKMQDHNSIAGSFPWVLLRDFNVILNYNENYRGIRVNNVGVYEFRDCVEAIKIEDVKMTGLFFTRIQKRSDPNIGILKKLDRVMGNGKFVDEYINGVHEALSRDPSNVHLREEELVYSENDEMAAMFVEHFKRFFGKCDVIYPIEDHVNLFTKKLDHVTAVELISAVSDEEIKMVLFDIKDNTASGLDGYTSKFFKSAWSMVGKDTCAAVKEFFASGKLLVSASVIRMGLDEFCLSSGLLPSMSKSEAFFGNVFVSAKADISLVMPFKEGVLPIRYLGVTMASKMITDRDCMVMVEVIRKRVGDWRNKSLSFAGNEWIWPIEWDDRFEEVINVQVPIIKPEVSDKTVWIDKADVLKAASIWNFKINKSDYYRRMVDELFKEDLFNDTE
nr:hypothetical protein [Tanacetum cinerariifolium]GEW43701.1 hypothetical protein [Tanacetum cinerariifolium]